MERITMNNENVTDHFTEAKFLRKIAREYDNEDRERLESIADLLEFDVAAFEAMRKAIERTTADLRRFRKIIDKLKS